MPPDEIQIQISGNDQTREVFLKLTQRVTRLERENAKLTRSLDRASKRVTNLREKLVLLDRRHQTTRDRVTRLTGSLETQSKQISSLTRNFDALASRQQKQANQLREVTVENAKLRRQLDRVRNSQNQVRSSGERLRQTNRQSADEVIALSSIWNDFAGALFSVSGILTRVGNVGLRAVQEFGRAALEIDRARESFIALTDSVSTAENRIEDLWEVAQLPGVTFRGALQSAQLLEAVGVAASDARRLIIEFGNAIELSGRTQVDFRETLRQVAQGISRNKIQQEELNVIFERAPIIARAVKEAYGTIDPEVITKKLEEAGETAEDFWRRIANEALPRQARANIDSLSNRVTNLQNAWEQLLQGLGTAIIPEIKGLTDALRGLTDSFNELAPAQQRAVALTTTGGTFFAKFGGAILEVVANIGLATFGIRQMRGAMGNLQSGLTATRTGLKGTEGQIRRFTNAAGVLNKILNEGRIDQDKAAAQLAKLATQMKLNQDQAISYATALGFGTAANFNAVTAAKSAAGAFVGLGKNLVRFLPYVGIGVAVIGALAFGFNQLGKNTTEATEETEKFEGALDRVNTRAGYVAELKNRIAVLVRYRGAIRQNRRDELPLDAPSEAEIARQIAFLSKEYVFYRDSDLPAIQRRFVEEIDKNTALLDEIYERRQKIFETIETPEISFQQLRVAESPAEIFRLFDRTTRELPAFAGLIQELRDLDTESEKIEAVIDRFERIFIALEADSLEPTSKTLSDASQFARDLLFQLNALNMVDLAISEPISIRGLEVAAENARRLINEVALSERLQALAAEEARDKDKRDRGRFANEILQIDLEASKARLNLARRVADQRVTIYAESVSAIRAQAGVADTTRQIDETTMALLTAIDELNAAQKSAAQERERSRHRELQDSQALNRELVRIDEETARQRVTVYQQASTRISSVLTSVLGLVTDRPTLDMYRSELDSLTEFSIAAVRDIEMEEIAQARAREIRRDVNERDAQALADEIVEIERRAQVEIETIQTNSQKKVTAILRAELDARIASVQEFNKQRRASIVQSRDFAVQLDLDESERHRDQAKRNLTLILNDENSTTEARLEALQHYQEIAEDYNDTYLYQFQQNQNDLIAVTKERTRTEMQLEQEVADFRRQIRERQVENDLRINQSRARTSQQEVLRVYERESAANARELERQRVARREAERARLQRERDAEREQTRLVAIERRALSQRLQDYNTFYNALRNLDLSSVDSVILGLARVVTEHVASLALRLAAERAYAAQKAAIEAGSALSSATSTGARAGLAAIVSNPLAIGAIVASLGISAFTAFRSRQESAEATRAEAAAQTRTFHDPMNDALARAAGRRYADMDIESRANVRRSARDFTNAFEAGASEGRATDGGEAMPPIVIQLQMNDRTVQEFTVRADTMRQQGRLIGRRR